jgi:large subunit ribosomal protein L22
MEGTRAVAKFVRIAPRKVRRVVDLVRGKYVDEALAILKFLPTRAAKPVSKVIQSAAANAETNDGMDPDLLKVSAAMVDQGPTWKRIKPRAMGRTYRILKRTSHITIYVQEGPERPQRRRGRRALVTRATTRG